MVYYYTVENIKLLKYLIDDYAVLSETTPHEFIKAYLEKIPDTVDDSELAWIVETFLGFEKHYQFLQLLTKDIVNQLSGEDLIYFTILLYGITFQIEPVNAQLFYKNVFNLSKPLLQVFTETLSGDNIINVISEEARSHYDTAFVTETIIRPLFEWQPYIRKLGNNYAEYVEKIESRKHKPPTVPVQLNVLNRKGKSTANETKESVLSPLTPPNSMQQQNRKMLTKASIDKKLKISHIKNQEKAISLLNEANKTNLNCCKTKTNQQIPSAHYELQKKIIMPICKRKPCIKQTRSLPVVKDNAITLKRLNKRVHDVEEAEVRWLQNILQCCGNASKIEELEEFDRKERERERLIEIEKKHLQGQISHEDAVIAKTMLKQENKKKYEQFIKDKEIWTGELENWRKAQMEKNRKLIEDCSVIELQIIAAKNNVVAKNKEAAENVKKESEIMLQKAIKLKQEELERRATMIKEIKLLSELAKKARSPKIIDLTESSGLGLLCEMSIAELQERLNAMKIGLKDELEQKKKQIVQENLAAKQDLEETKVKIKDFMKEQANMRKQNKNNVFSVNKVPTKEINDLKSILEEKKKLRLELTG